MQPCTVVVRDGRSTAYASSMQQLAFVFPGQGSQAVGMGRTLADGSPAAAAVFAAADRALDERLTDVAWDGPAERLDLTENAQPAILAASIAILEALRERWSAEGLAVPVPAYAAGHSMGQYSASSRRRSSRGRHPARARARTADAGVRTGSRRGDGCPHRTR
jgi:[acyl-carrier-protein] S-malonyltransferase